MTNLPKHIAIIMDGNGRWAAKRNKLRMAGHKAGGEVAKEIIDACRKRNIAALTLFAFSSENWQRPSVEVNYLMERFLKGLENDAAELVKNNIRLRIIGERGRLQKKLRNQIVKVEELTHANSGLQLNIALNYSGRWDIFQAAARLAQNVAADMLPANAITEEAFQALLCLHDLPEPDLLIRTSGERRLSNFMLWQLAYTELYFTDALWPDFNEAELELALQAYAQRERRFGGI
ncbi:MAG: isoprenyl transferase [Gammaproteobacteria bacterium]|nr:isoprenyl transferase [Gammaproteobacteria bacterium]